MGAPVRDDPLGQPPEECVGQGVRLRYNGAVRQIDPEVPRAVPESSARTALVSHGAVHVLRHHLRMRRSAAAERIGNVVEDPPVEVIQVLSYQC